MTDELHALKAALQASAPPADPKSREAALRLALENYDRVQGSAVDPRQIPDRPSRAGLQGVWKMLKSALDHPVLTTATSVAALCVVALIVLPTLEPSRPTLPVSETRAPSTPQQMTPETTEPDQPAPAADAGAARTKDLAAPEQALSDAALPDAAPSVTALPQSAPPVPAEGPAITFAEPPPPAPALTGGMAAATVAPMAEALAPAEPDTETFSNAPLNPVHLTSEEPVSTFSADVDTASYAVIRSSLQAGYLPPPEAVRVEEMVNYFPYDYAAPQGDAAFATHVAVMPTPWNPGTRLVRIGLQGRMPAVADRPALNLVFLIDTSGSMEDPGKLPLLKQSLRLMLPRLGDQDRIAIVTYAGSAGEVLAPTPASDRAAIEAALDRLEAGGSTAGAEGIHLAYQVAQGMKREGTISRVLLATDGDFNVGISDPAALTAMIAAQRDSGTYLSVLGFGRGNLDDQTMQALAQNGNGTAAYIDTASEAQKVLGDQLTGALFPIADDVKIQVEWNPAQVAEYRLIGYETRALRREDFSNDRVDAGEVGAGLQVTALYEITAPGSPALLNDPLRYGTKPADPAASAELGFLRLRWKAPGAATSQLDQTPITGREGADDEARFAAAIAGFGQLLQGAPYLGQWGWDQLIQLAGAAKGPDPYGYRAEAVALMRLAASLAAR